MAVVARNFPLDHQASQQWERESDTPLISPRSVVEKSMVGLTVLPEHPTSDQSVRLVATTRDPKQQLEIVMFDEQQRYITATRREKWGYIPTAFSSVYAPLKPGTYTAQVQSKDGITGVLIQVAVVEVSTGILRSKRSLESGVWTNTRQWTPLLDDLFAAFVSKLFYVRPGSRKGWKPLHGATRDPYRNILYGILGLEEDRKESDNHVVMTPDCADAPYQLRAYFAWKMGLPFLFSSCSRGSATHGSVCNRTFSNRTDRYNHIDDPVERYNVFVKSYIGWQVHSGNARTSPESHGGDYYSISLKGETIRPGHVFVDVGGHVIMISQVELQSEQQIGTIYGIDAHPDRTVTHKQFSKGTFVFTHEFPTDGFKAFRPIHTLENGDTVYLTNDEITQSNYSEVSEEQALFSSSEEFYERVENIFNPESIDPRIMLKNKTNVFYAAALERVDAVEAGVVYMAKQGWRTMPMPNGPDIFQTDGPWEIYSTPARDMRFFLSLDDMMEFPRRIVKRYAKESRENLYTARDLLKELNGILKTQLETLSITYTRSDGTRWTLSLMEIVRRQKQLEMAYNPNDCPEKRWAAPYGSKERSSCRNHAPKEQIRQMERFRFWFASRRRPDQR